MFTRISFPLLMLLCCKLQAQNWQATTAFPGAGRDDGVSFTVSNNTYCGTGLLPWFLPSGDFYALDVFTDTWTPVASMPAGQERQYACAFSYGHSGFVFGGVNGSLCLNTLWEYNAIQNNWSARTAMPDSGRSGSCCFLLGDTAFVVGGKTASGHITNDVWAYVISSDLWISMNNLPFGGRWRAAAEVVNGKGYLIFGLDEYGILHKEVYAYLQSSDSWTAAGIFPGPGRTYATAATLNNRLLVACGIDSSGMYYRDLWSFDPPANAWQSLDTIPAAARKGGLLFAGNNALYYSTGISSNNLRLTETWKIQNPTSVPLQHNESRWVIYPNPAADEVHIFISGADHHTARFSLLDISGKTVYEKQIRLPAETVDISGIPAGSYLAVIRGSSVFSSMKLFIR